MINCGAFVFPLTWGLYFTQYNAIEAAQYFHYVFYFSAFFVIINMIITLTLYKNPKEPESEKNITTVFKNAAIVVKDFKFFSLLIIYSGFWFMFAMNHTYLPLYMLNFQIMPGWFTPLLLATINPGTIIIMGPYLSRYADRYPSLQLMIIGIIIFMSGLLIIAFSQTPAGLFGGIIVFSVGEFLTHPSFISYTSKIAPKDKVTIYMGYIFIATGIGLVLGSLFGGALYESIAKNMASPTLFWGIVISIGLISTFFFIYYNRKYSGDQPEEEGIVIEKPIIPMKKGILDNNLTMIMPLLAIPIVLFLAQSAGTQAFHELEYDIDTGPIIIDWENDYELIDIGPVTRSGGSTEGAETIETIEVEETNIVEIIFTLTWTDEPAASGIGQYENQPDRFSLEILSPDSQTTGPESASNPQNGQGTISISVDYSPNKDPYMNGTGVYNVSITCDSAGDHTPSIGPGIIRQPVSDNGNDWNLEITYSYYEKN
jgi:MFS family permease